jgi:hypothetical protein
MFSGGVSARGSSDQKFCDSIIYVVLNTLAHPENNSNRAFKIKCKN